MKYFKVSFLFLICCLLLLTNCQNDNGDAVEKVNIIEEDITILSSETLTYKLGNIPTEGNVSIQKQAVHSDKSEIGIDNEQGGLNYIYKPVKDFAGSDYVEIVRKSSIGNNTFCEKDVIKISITVIESDN